MQGDRYFGVKGTYKAVIGAARDNTRFFQKRLPAWYILSGIKNPLHQPGIMLLQRVMLLTKPGILCRQQSCCWLDL